MEQQMRKQREPGHGEANSPHVIYEDFQPSAGWTQESNCHVLLIGLPDFKKKELKVEVDSSGKIIVSGERNLIESKRIRFKKVFDVPKDSDVDKEVRGRLNGGFLYVTIPIKATAKAEEPNKIENAKNIAKEEKKHGHGEKKDIKERIDGISVGLTGEEGKKSEREDWKKRLEKMREKEVLDGFMENAKEMISRNKNVIVTAVLAISVGLYISHRIRSGGR